MHDKKTENLNKNLNKNKKWFEDSIKFESLFKFIQLLPSNTEIIENCPELDSRIYNNSNILDGSYLGLCFRRDSKNQYSYDLTFHSRLVHVNSDNWIQ